MSKSPGSGTSIQHGGCHPEWTHTVKFLVGVSFVEKQGVPVAALGAIP